MTKSMRLLLLASVFATAAFSAQAETLEDAMALAYQNNPELAAQRYSLRAQDEDVAIAKSGSRLQAGISSSLDQNNYNASGAPGDGTTNWQTGLNISQPIFRGGRNKNSVRAATSSVMAGRESLRATEQGILYDTVVAYSDVIRDEAIVKLNQNQVNVLRQQMQETRDRFRVGELTRTDVAQSEARLSGALSRRIAADGALTVSREAYRRVVGQEPGTLVEPKIPQLPPTLDEAVQAAGAENPQLNAARKIEESARHQVAVAKGAVLPSVDAVGSFVNNKNWGSTSVFAGRNYRSAAIGARLTVPIYQTGAEYARGRQAQERASQAQLNVLAADRQVTEQVRGAWAQLTSARAGIEAQQEVVRAAEIALQGVKQEQTVGARTTLDVLNAEQELLSARVGLVDAKRNETVAAYGVLAAVGRLDVKSQGLKADYYDPAKHFDDVKNKWFGWDAK